MCEDIEHGEPSSPITGASDSEKPKSAGADAAKAQASLKARKRTKTGCLTCRKRRIKCGEERPVCANCIKSKRSCEGYAPRLTFKDPLNAYQSWPQRGFMYGPPPHGASTQYIRPYPPATVYPPSQYHSIAPRPTAQGQPEYYIGAPQNQMPPNWPQTQPGQHPSGYIVLPNSTIPPQVQQVYQQFTAPTPTSNIQPSPTYSNSPVQVSQAGVPPSLAPHGPPVVTSSQWLHDAVAVELASNRHEAGSASPMTPVAAPHLTRSTISPITPPPMDHASPPWTEIPEMMSEAHQRFLSLDAAPTSSHPAFVPFTSDSAQGMYDHITVDTGHPHLASSEIGSSSGDQSQPPTSATEGRQQQQQKPSGPALLYEPDHGMQEYDDDDDYYDVMSDEEEGPQDDNVVSYPPAKDVHHILALANSRPDQDMRSYHSFLDESNILANYMPKFHNSPLMHSPTAKVFCHFVAATGPLLSSYGRHPVNPALFFSGTPAPKSNQALWTYTIPTLALSNHALLQSMLALAALQISRLQSTSLTVPMKHYHFALRRVAHSVSIPSKRATISTLAATLLLAHFEVISGEHSKWSSHLTGARQLLLEVDFKGMTQRIINEKARLASNVNMNWSRPFVNAQFQSYGDDLPWVPDPSSVDEGVVAQLTGMKVKYDRHGSVIDESNQKSKRPLSEKEMDEYQTYRDLFWFFTKLDMIQSLIRGRPLLLPYDRWVTCPPRGPIGRVDAVYGSLDHVHLLLGRIGDFAGKDLQRKRKAMRMNGGSWRPPPGMFPSPTSGGPPSGPPPGMPGAPPQGSSPISPMSSQRPPMPGAPSGPSPAQPSFYGMMPDTGTSYDLPEGFASAPRENLYVPPSPDDNFELATATATAEEEWKDIQKALTIFETSLGPSFAPLSADAGPVIATPFGLALQYRTYQIALCWIHFYMGRIVAARTHPSMPPASMMASGVAASQTAQWTNTVGRIVFGMQTPSDDQPLNPTFGGALAETMLPLFVAGVQYMDPHQRTYTIERLQMIAERVGHDSAALIAAGLETVWVKQAEMGRGPKYEPTVRVQDERGTELAFPSAAQPKIPYTPMQGKSRDKGGEGEKRGAVYLQADTKDFAAGLMSLEEDFGEMGIGGGGS